MTTSTQSDVIESLVVPLHEAKRHLRVTHGDDDVEIAEMVRAATEYVETVTHRVISRRNFEYRLSCFPHAALVLPRYPVESVTEIEYTDSDGNQQTFEDFDHSDGIVCPQAGTHWPVARNQLVAVIVRFVAGHAEPPAAAKHAIKLIVGDAYKNREPVGAKSIGGSAGALINTLKTNYTIDA